MSGEGLLSNDRDAAHASYCGWHIREWPSDCTCAADGLFWKMAADGDNDRFFLPAPSTPSGQISTGDNYDNRAAGSGRAGNWMQTFTGRQFWPIDPRADEVFIEDIAHGLSNVCRFSGQCDEFYSVAEHSVLVSHCVPAEWALMGLLHDATEAYVGDISRPLKPYLTGYKEIELRVWRAIADCYGLRHDMPSCIKLADNAVLLAEGARIMKPHPAPWCVPGEAADVKVACWTPFYAKWRFLERFRELTLARGAA